MTKALMVMNSAGTAQLSGAEAMLVGGAAVTTTTEANAQMAASQEATFSKLSCNITSGGSGTNDMRFRNNGGDGNQLASRVGTGLASDATNTDTVAAGNPFNLAFTDTGSSPAHSWVKANVEFTSGHGCFHGAVYLAGRVYDVASATRFIPFNGEFSTDGLAVATQLEYKVRAYDTFVAMQVRVSANARTNDSTFKNLINGSDGTGVITFGAGVTGLLQDTAVGDSIADGDLICASVTLGTGVEDLTLVFVGCTLTSSTAKCDCCLGHVGGIARAASSTAVYAPLGGSLDVIDNGFSEAQARVPVGFAGTASNLRIYLSANTYTGSATLKLYQNGSPVITTTINAAATGWIENTADTVSFAATDELSYEIDEGTSGSITMHAIAVTLAASAVAGVFVPLVSRGSGGTLIGGFVG